MSTDKESVLRKRIGIFYENNKHLKKVFTVNHFVLEGVPKRTIYNAFERVEIGKSLDRKSGTGLSNSVSKKIKEKIVQRCVNEVGLSYSQVSREYGISDKYVKKILREYEVYRKKRTIAPKSNEKQKLRQKKCLETLRRGIFKPSIDSEIIIDDESYFTFDGALHDNDYYHAYEGMQPLDDSQYKFVSKFPGKVMVWLAMSSKGISKPFVTKSGNAINANIYINECIKKRLVPFIDKYHKEDDIVFWPDLASSHYANATIETLNELKINFVPKKSNPPNVPQLRPIEKFWANLKRVVYKNGWKAENYDQLIKKIKLELSKMSVKTCQNHMRRVKTRIRLAADRGVLSVIN
jgi:transposase-like protein/transposase